MLRAAKYDILPGCFIVSASHGTGHLSLLRVYLQSIVW